MSSHRVTLDINGEPHSLDVTATQTLLDALRWQLDLTGTKKCCAEGECGACTVLINGLAVNSCLVLAAELHGASVTTIEGIGTPGSLSWLQDAFLAEGAVQCGFCIPGMAMAAHALLAEQPHPDAATIRDSLSGNLCRCAGYPRILRAVQIASSQADE